MILHVEGGAMKARTREVYEALCEAKAELGIPPTIRQLTEGMGLDVNAHLSSVYYALAELVDFGLVEKRVPTTAGLYVPTLPPDEVDWEALEGDGDGREALEEGRERDSGVLRDSPDSQEGG
jgi:hypothetical protein